VCSFRRIDPSEYINPYYMLKSFINTWSGFFNSYGNPRDWQIFHDATIRPDPTKINKSRRRKIKFLMVMIEMESQISRLSSRGEG
jgi:hypothetical protein